MASVTFLFGTPPVPWHRSPTLEREGSAAAFTSPESDDMTSLVVEVPGSSVEIEAPAPTGDELARSLVDLPQGGAIDHRLELVERDGTLDLLCDGDIVRGGVDPRVAAATVVWKLNSFVAASPDHVVIHAGGVTGVGAVLLAGPSGCGKTTLSAACLRRGMSYLSDEFAVLDLATGLVVPYWKPLGFADDSLVPATHLLSDCLGEASAPCCIVFPEHAPGAPQGFDHVEPAFGLLGLAANTFDLAGAGGLKFRMLAGLATQADALRLTHHDAPGVAGGDRRTSERSCFGSRSTPRVRTGDEVDDHGRARRPVRGPGARRVGTRDELHRKRHLGVRHR